MLRIQFLSILLCLTVYGESRNEVLMEKATFGGGCFWCMEHPFESLPGVKNVISGYAGGTVKNPTYEQVKSGQTGHAESVQVLYDPKKIPYRELLDAYWKNINPTQKNGQFNDHGPQYRTVIFYHSEAQKKRGGSIQKAIRRKSNF